MKFIKKNLLRIIKGFLLLYIFGIINKNNDVFLPINIFTLTTTSLFSVYGLLALMLLKITL